VTRYAASTVANGSPRRSSDVLAVQRRLGHASAVMTLDRYGHLMEGEAEAVADRLKRSPRSRRAHPSSVGPHPSS
jgi:integrase